MSRKHGATLILAAVVVAATVCLATATATSAHAQDLVVDATTMTLGGVRRFDNIRVINGGRIIVADFDGVDRVNTGNLVLVATGSIFVDATSSITARGAGYRAVRCGNGPGPVAMSGGAGGCALRDSGGGGAHFGQGGRGTKDCFIFGDPSSCQFPQEFEEDCGNSLNAGGTACTTTSNCRNNDGLPTVAGRPYWHSIWEVEFGASGGDKGCRDGDGFGAQPNVAGAGGGRLVLAAVNATDTGNITIDGVVTTSGKRGCGTGNDSAGGGAGGSLLIVGDMVSIGATARVSAAGALGGDTFAAAAGSPDSADCPAGAQTGGTCDDCGGGGGGGIVSVLSRAATISPSATFDVSGGAGGVCPICRGEAGGGTGELQLNVAYVGEVCDGYDNDFDGMIDEGLGTFGCGLGMCTAALPVCTSGEPTLCMPDTTGGGTCLAGGACNKPRVAVILDTSASMLQDLSGYATFGDGSADQPGLDTDMNGMPDDSRLFLAKSALGEVISSYPEIDFSLARYHQDQAVDQSCQLATWIECAGIFATYDDPRDNTGPVSCTVPTGPTTTVDVRRDSVGGEECINYAGSCGGPRRGADVLSGFGADTRDVVRWLDGRELMFIDDETTGDFCRHSATGDCEIRATGPTPLEGALQAIEDYVVPIRTTDPCTACRGYTVILVTDGVESCGGDPVAQARVLHDTHGVDVFVVAVSVLASERAALDAIAMAGTGGAAGATFVTRPEELVPALTDIVGGSIRFETCNGLDDDCDSLIDEGFPGLGTMCDDGGIGACRGTGAIECRADGSGTECVIDMPGGISMMETCNAADDDCDGRIDEGLSCMMSCTPTGPEVCNGIDDDCNGLIDEADPALDSPCGETEGTCEPGTLRCIRGMLECVGAIPPREEVCNGEDDDCDGIADDMAPCPGVTMCIEGACRRPCDPAEEFPCPPGLLCVARADGSYCLPSPCARCTAEERCIDDACVNVCTDVMCEPNETCIVGICRDCRTLGCPATELCFDGSCIADPCDAVACGVGESCFEGACAPSCDDRTCPPGERCGADRRCEPDPCAGTSCAAGEVCIDGSCRDNPCDTVRCASGEVCRPEVGCTADACAVTRCEAGRVCAVDAAGIAQCVLEGEPPPDPDYVLAAGGGCDCHISGRASEHGSSGALSWLAFAVLASFVARRRK